MSTPLHSKMVRNTLFAALLMGIIPSPKLLAQAATTQIWTGITPPPEGGSSYTLDQVTSGVWDGTTANWANATVNTPTSYYAFAAGSGRIANFLPKTAGYTVTLAYDTPVLRALGVSGGNSNGKVMIQSNAAQTITFNGTNSYIIISTGRELTIGQNTALKGDFVLHTNGGGTLRWSGAAAAYQSVMTLGAGTFIIDADAGSRMGGNAQFLIQGGSVFNIMAPRR